MLGNARGEIVYTIGDRKLSYSWNGFDFPSIEGLHISGQSEGYTSWVELTPADNTDILRIISLEWTIPFPFTGDERVFLNGYQSWTDSWERGINETVKPLSILGRLLNPLYKFSKYGDYEFVNTSSRSGDFHGFTYGYIRPEGGPRIIFLGSLSEAEGFTLIRTSASENTITAAWDCEGVLLDRPRRVLELFFDEGEDDDVFDSWFNAMELIPPEAPESIGWTSWYNHYQNINESIILKNLEGFRNTSLQIDTFQIDDGYQTYVGDWLSLDKQKFPGGLKKIVNQVHATGLKAGLWLAPFAAEKKSVILKEHPDWILKDQNGKKVWGGANWGGFYALDFYNSGVRRYIRKVFATILTRWHFDMVKLDFLYAVCLSPPANKTRGEVMGEAMAFLRECVGEKIILGCGVPLGSAFGLVEYCRIGCDISLDWNNRWQSRFFHREGVSTRNSIGNAIGRRHLDGRAFLNDPDVFILRDDNIKMTGMERETLFRVNSVTGSLLFTSDLVSSYREESTEAFKSLGDRKKLLHVAQDGDVVRLKYLDRRREKVLVVNLSENIYRQDDLLLMPRETIIL